MDESNFWTIEGKDYIFFTLLEQFQFVENFVENRARECRILKTEF